MKQQKVLSVMHGSTRIECIQVDRKTNPFIIRLVWYSEGKCHRRIMNKYADFASVLAYLLDFENAHLANATPEQKLAWARQYK